MPLGVYLTSESGSYILACVQIWQMQLKGKQILFSAACIVQHVLSYWRLHHMFQLKAEESVLSQP